MLEGRPELAEIPLVADWALLSRPVIVRRRSPGERTGDIPAALPLPPSHGKQRIALSFPPEASIARLPSVLLEDAALAAPAAWQPTVAALLECGRKASSVPSVFGALLWEYATRLPYLTARSDLDLLWPVSSEEEASLLVGELLRLDCDGPVRIDGELLLPDGAAVHWREYADATSEVLAKTMDGVEVRPKAELFREPVPA